ncbi:MAG TPA: hypothetical protein VF669_20090 [Tepidisphaeraceae bacterium]|jgi:hypothetical protein
MSEKEKSDGGFPSWPTLLALMAVATGLFVFFSPLTSSRPRITGTPLRSLGEEHVDARLWQDPLVATQQHDDDVSKKTSPLETESHDVWRLRNVLQDSGNSVLVVPVIISGSPYPDQVEFRLRQRYAVLSALATAGYAPADGNHIGYVRVPWPWRKNGISKRDDWQGAESADGDESLLLPYEWCQPQYSIREVRSSLKRQKILLLWLRDEALSDEPLDRIAWLLKKLALKAGNEQVRVLGPSNSPTLRKMVENAASRTEVLQKELKGVQIFASLPTAWDLLLVRGLKDAKQQPVKCSVSAMESVLGELNFHRTILTDELVADELIEELRRRRVDPGNPDHHIACIAEWDTLYGRSLPITFAARGIWSHAKLACTAPASSDGSGELERLLNSRSMVTDCPWFHPFSYMRGIDGRLPGDDVKEKQQQSNKNQKDVEKTSQPQEDPEGLNQTDYLRRLAARLEALDADLKRKSGEGLKAIGILGSDIYDKLLVMRSLRVRLPGAVYFTNNLDARMFHPSEWAEAKNLVVGSPFGLRLRDQYQGTISPFRDSYQTAQYAGMLLLLTAIPADVDMKPPRLHVIGRNGPYDISIDPYSEVERAKFDPDRVTTIADLSNGRIGKTIGSNMPSIHPALSSQESWWNNERTRLAQYALLLALIVAAWMLLWAELLDIRQWSSKLWRVTLEISTRTRLFVPVFLTLSIGAVWMTYRKGWPVGEPLTLDGNSVWPSEALKLLALLLCVHFFFKSRRDLLENDKQIKEVFDLDPLTKRDRVKPSKKNWNIACDDRGEAVPMPEGRKFQDNERVDAKRLWEEYQVRGLFRNGVRRYGPIILAFYVFGLLVFAVLGWPTFPGRGVASLRFDLFVSALLSFALVALTFFVVDAMRLNEVLIDYLSRGVTYWPEKTRSHWLKEVGSMKALDLAELLDVSFIAKRTEVVGRMIWYPFAVLFLIVMARLEVFAKWDWPASVIIMMLCMAAVASFSAALLRDAAEVARTEALKRLRNRLMLTLVNQQGARRDVIQRVISIVETVDHGAYAPLTRQPLIRAIVLPSGGVGVLALVQYLNSLI